MGMKVLYGRADFKAIRTEGYSYIDKTNKSLFTVMCGFIEEEVKQANL